MLVYTFDYETKAYTGEKLLGIGDLSQREHDVIMIPGNATIIPPPRCGKRLWPFWRNDHWQVMEEVEQPGAEYWDGFGL